MQNRNAMNVRDVADMLNISKSSVYSLTKQGCIKSYNLGRNLRFTESDILDYIKAATGRRTSTAAEPQTPEPETVSAGGGFVLCGQDLMLDVLSNQMHTRGVPALRSYIGSYDSLTMLYRNKVHVASSHMWDSDSDEYNVAFVRRLVPGIPTIIVHLTYRMQGLYVAKGNPLGITGWEDFNRHNITMINRECGAGSRVLLDENLRILGIKSRSIKGYDNTASSHLAVASAVSSGVADVAVGIEKIARQVDNIDFIPLKKEQYDLVLRKENLQTDEVRTMLQIIRSGAFRDEFAQIGGYDTREMGRIVAEL